MGLIRRPPTSRDKDREVLVGQITAEAEPEPPLSGRRAVARSHVAAGLAEGRDHVAAKAHRRRLVHPLDLDGRTASRLPRRATIVAVPFALGTTRPLGVTVGDLGVQAHPLDRARLVLDRAVGGSSRRDELRGRAPADQPGLRRRDRELGSAGRRRRRSVRSAVAVRGRHSTMPVTVAIRIVARRRQGIGRASVDPPAGGGGGRVVPMGRLAAQSTCGGHSY